MQQLTAFAQRYGIQPRGLENIIQAFKNSNANYTQKSIEMAIQHGAEKRRNSSTSSSDVSVGTQNSTRNSLNQPTTSPQPQNPSASTQNPSLLCPGSQNPTTSAQDTPTSTQIPLLSSPGPQNTTSTQNPSLLSSRTHNGANENEILDTGDDFPVATTRSSKSDIITYIIN